MKISKKLWVYIGITAWVFIAGIMGYAILKQMNEKSTVNAEISANQALITSSNSNDLESQKQSLEAQSEDLKSQIAALTAGLEHDKDNVIASDTVFAIAQKHKVQIVSLSAPAALNDYLINLPSDVITIQAVVEGTVPNLVNFVSELNTNFDTGMIQNCDIEIDDSGNMTPSVSLVFELYNYQGE